MSICLRTSAGRGGDAEKKDHEWRPKLDLEGPSTVSAAFARTAVSQARSHRVPLSEIPPRQLVSLRQLAAHCW